MKTSTDNLEKLSHLNIFLEGHNGYIAGGCFKDIFNNKKPKDIDIFFNNCDDFENAEDYFDKSKEYKYVYSSDNAYCYKHLKTGIYVDIICKIYGKPEDVIEQFDFSITKYAYYKEKEKYVSVFNDFYFKHLENKVLCFNGEIPYPVHTLKRLVRYIQRGYSPTFDSLCCLVSAIKDCSEEELDETFYYMEEDLADVVINSSIDEIEQEHGDLLETY